MIPVRSAPLDANGYMANEEDWALFVDATTRLARFVSGTVIVAAPDGKSYMARCESSGEVTFSTTSLGEKFAAVIAGGAA